MNHSQYNYTRWFDKRGRPWHLDDRHIDLLHAACLAVPQGSILWEIGCWHGASTTAFIEALKQREDLRLYLFDTEFSKELKRLVYESGVSHRVDLYEQPAYTTDLKVRPALTLIDGDHSWPALADLALCLALDCEIIILHDTQATGPKTRKLHHGSILAANILRQASGRRCFEDCLKRDGEYTERGILLSWKANSEFDPGVLL